MRPEEGGVRVDLKDGAGRGSKSGAEPRGEFAGNLGQGPGKVRGGSQRKVEAGVQGRALGPGSGSVFYSGDFFVLFRALYTLDAQRPLGCSLAGVAALVTHSPGCWEWRPELGACSPGLLLQIFLWEVVWKW